MIVKIINEIRNDVALGKGKLKILESSEKSCTQEPVTWKLLEASRMQALVSLFFFCCFSSKLNGKM